MPRYIDAILLAYTYLEVAREDGLTGLRFLTPEDVASKILELSEEIDEVAPVVHAHWIEVEDYSGTVYPECSHCGLVWWLEEGTAEENEMYYCPKCGAIMDEVVS